jgi:phosphoribosyl-ATP pyrophosphohydrolase
MAHWRVELTTQDVVALSEGREVAVAAVDEEQEGLADETLDVTVTLVDL